MRSRSRAAKARVWILAAAIVSAAAASAQSTEDRHFSSNGVRIRYIDVGAGPAVVLVHGRSGGLAPFIDVGLVANLARDHRVIALDLRGHGKSERPADAAAYPGQLTGDILRLLDHLRLRRAHLVGYSLGGALVAKLMTEHPDRLMTATIGASGGHRLSRLERETPRDPENAFEVYYSGGHRDTHFADEDFAATKVPVLRLVGSDDTSLAGMKELQALLPAMRLVVIEGATHVGAKNAPARPEFAKAIRDFVRTHQ